MRQDRRSDTILPDTVKGANGTLGLTPGPTAFPWQTHARGLAGHLVFGVPADTALRALDRVA